MHAPLYGDARASLHPNSCEASLIKPMDRSSSFDRQSFGRFNRGDKEKFGIGKDRQISSTALASFQNATFSPTSKHRSFGWHGESRRHSRDYTQSPEPTSLCGLRSSTGRGTFGNRHHQRDLHGKSLANYSSATRLVTDNRSMDNERSIPVAISSPTEGKDVAVTSDIDQPSHSSLAVVWPIDTYLSSGRSGFLQPDSLGCTPYNTELEVRVDKYVRSDSVDLFVSKDPPSDQKIQERKSNGRISPLYSTAANPLIVDGGMKLPGFSDAPFLSPPVISPSSCDESNYPFPRKRPRLGWGQGLAKYEKKKVFEIEKVALPESPKDHNQLNLEISEVPCNCSSTGLSISAICDRHTEKCILSDVSSQREAVKLEIAPVVCIESFINDGRKSSGERQFGHKMGSIQNAFNASKKCLDLTCAREQTSSENKMVESYHYPSAPGACYLKEIILLNIEKVELEVDSVEKELAKLNCQIQLQNTNNLKDNECGAQRAVYPKTPVSSDPQSNLVSDTENHTQVCMNSFIEKCTLNAIQASDGIHSCISDASAGVLQLERDAIQQKVECDNLEAQSSKSIKSLPGKDCLLLSNIPSQQNYWFHDQDLFYSRKYGASSNFCEAIINENQEQANDAGKKISHLQPSSLLMIGGNLYESPEGAPNWFHNREFHQKSKEALKEQLERNKKLSRFKEQLVVFRYQALSQILKQEQFGLAKKKYCSKAVWKYDTKRRNGYVLNKQRSSSRLHLSSFGIAKRDTLSDKLPVIEMPAMIVDEKEELSWRFVTRNALVEDPVATEQERKTINPWTLEEKKVFLEKFTVFRKNFAKIASCLQQKTVADCIEFYYRNKKLEDFEKVACRQKQPKKRSYFTKGSHSYLATTSTAKRFSESNAAGVDTLSTVATLASSGSVAKDFQDLEDII